MTSRLTIGVALCLCGGVCCAAISQLDAEDAVRRRMVQRGLPLGTDLETGSYTVIASAVKSGSEPGSSADGARRTTCFRLAELKAVHQILNMRAQTMTGMSEARRERAGGEAVKTMRTFVETFSQSDMDGCVVVDSCELNEGESCVVAIAMTWSADLENRARASAAGSLQPAATWVDELARLLDGWGDVLWPPTVSFVDSAGFFHRVGVGIAGFAGESPLARNAAVAQADLWARKNLQLAFYGAAAMRKKAELMKASSRRADARSTASAYEALSEVAAEGPLPVGSCPLFDRVVPDASGSGKLFVVVYGVKAPRAETAQGGACRAVVPIAEPASQVPSGVMLFNPNTGKFEKQ